MGSQIIYGDGEYAGSVCGQVVGGKLSWDPSHETATINLKLVADGGTDAFAKSVGRGDFVGELGRSGVSPSICGTLTLNY